MTQGRQPLYAACYIYKEMTNKLGLIDVANEFRFRGDERSLVFGHFSQNDLHFKILLLKLQ